MRDTIDGINEPAWTRAMSRTPEQSAYRSFKTRLTRRVNRKDWPGVDRPFGRNSKPTTTIVNSCGQTTGDDVERAADDARIELARLHPVSWRYCEHGKTIHPAVNDRPSNGRSRIVALHVKPFDGLAFMR